ncbi:MAG: family 10 glycosylhydrolase [Armatimonadota bacterium]|nr:family 10 glycosylhydrolase [Armatimonadota bacterium]
MKKLNIAILSILLSLACTACVSAQQAAAPRPIEGRAIWMDSGAIPTNHSEIREMVDRYSQAGINILMPEVFRNGYTIYPSRIATQLPKFAPHDPLRVLISEAHKRKMEVHPWVWVFRVGHTGDQGGVLKQHPDWAAVNKSGEKLSPGGGLWLCPSMPETRKFLFQVYRELLANYDVDGIHLDYIRFENETPIPYCYNDSCRSKFKVEYGIDPIDIDPFSAAQLSWNSWRERLVNTFAQQVELEAKRIRPDLKVSAAVASEPNTARTSYMQNWPNWAANKWVDFLTPMTYTANTGRFRELVETEMATVDFKTLLFPGLGLHLHGSSSPMLEQIAAARESAASGVTLFASSYFKEPFIDAVREGPFSTKAKPPFRVSRDEIQCKAKGRQVASAAPTMEERDAYNLLKYLDYQEAQIGYVAPEPPPLFMPSVALPLPSVSVPKVTTPPKIDGQLSEDIWNNAVEITLNYTSMGDPAPVPTHIKLAYDDTNLYIGAMAIEPEMLEIRAAQTKRDGPVFYDDSIELFLDPGGRRKSYFHLAANTLGAQFDQRLLTPAWNGKWVVASGKSTDSWTLEFAIPFGELGALTPKPGDSWTANFARDRFVTGEPEYLTWSVTYGSFHQLYRFGSLIFN